jgi:hypothetical protein
MVGYGMNHLKIGGRSTKTCFILDLEPKEGCTKIFRNFGNYLPIDNTIRLN